MNEKKDQRFGILPWTGKTKLGGSRLKQVHYTQQVYVGAKEREQWKGIKNLNMFFKNQLSKI